MRAQELSAQVRSKQVDKGELFSPQYPLIIQEFSLHKSLWNCFRSLGVRGERLLAIEDNCIKAKEIFTRGRPFIHLFTHSFNKGWVLEGKLEGLMNSAVYFLESLTSSDEEDTQFMTMYDISPWFFVWQCLVDHQLLACLMALSCELCAWQNYIWMPCAVDLARVLMVFKWKIYEDREQSSFGQVGQSPFG